MSVVIFCLLFSFVDYVPVKREIIWYSFCEGCHFTWMLFPEKVCFNIWQTISLSRFYLSFFIYFLTRIALTQFTLKKIAGWWLRVGRICRDVDESKKRGKKKKPKKLLPGRLLHNNGNSARHLQVWVKDYFSQENCCRSMRLLKSGLQVVVSVSQLGNSANVPGT